MWHSLHILFISLFLQIASPVYSAAANELCVGQTTTSICEQEGRFTPMADQVVALSVQSPSVTVSISEWHVDNFRLVCNYLCFHKNIYSKIIALVHSYLANVMYPFHSFW